MSATDTRVYRSGGYIVVCVLFALTNGCFVQSACYSDADCPDNRTCVIPQGDKGGSCKPMCFEDRECRDGYICETVTHLCRAAECAGDAECREDFECVNGRCRPVGDLQCPEGMVPVDGTFCIDIFEASRPDATSTKAGQDESMAISKGGVLPWQVENNAEADAACLAADKRLCRESEWQQACMGSEGTNYSYGDEYDALKCNGIDTFCFCDAESCQSGDTCPFPYCYQQCGAAFHLEPTGAFGECTNDYGVFDINGNVWEHVLGGDDTRIRGGAYNCGDSKRLHRCDYIPGSWTPSARGFRCCAEGWVDKDAGVDR